MDRQAGRSAVPRREADYFSVELNSLRVDTVTNFPIYLKLIDSGQPLLYREEGSAFAHRTS